LLATAKISFEEPTGKLVTCRDVIDSGSQANLISRRMEDLRYHFAVTDWSTWNRKESNNSN